jgi:prepilin-type processing-associated H-X9-DG protein
VGLVLYVGDFQKSPAAYFVEGTNNQDVVTTWQDFLLPFCGDNTNLFQCPSQERGIQCVNPGLYGYNNGTGAGLGLAYLGDGTLRVRESDVRVPSDMMAIGDGPFSLFPLPATFTGYYGGMRDAHDAGANVVFCDGHVEYGKIVDWMKADDLHRQRWNNDNQPHPETWP